jgi:hypothetical protein
MTPTPHQWLMLTTAGNVLYALWCFVLTIRSNNLHRRLSAVELSRAAASDIVVRESNLVEPKGNHPGQTGLGAFPTRKGGEL